MREHAPQKTREGKHLVVSEPQLRESLMLKNMIRNISFEKTLREECLVGKKERAHLDSTRPFEMQRVSEM